MTIDENPNSQDKLDSDLERLKSLNNKSKVKNINATVEKLNPYLENMLNNSDSKHHKILHNINEEVKLHVLRAKHLGVPDADRLYLELFEKFLTEKNLVLNADFSVTSSFSFHVYNPMDELSFKREEKKKEEKKRKKVTKLGINTLRKAVVKVEKETKEIDTLHEFHYRKSIDSNPARDKVIKISAFTYKVLIRLNELSSPIHQENITNDIEEFTQKLIDSIGKFTGEVYDRKQFKEFTKNEVNKVNSELSTLYSKLYDKLQQPEEESPIGGELYKFTASKESTEFQELVRIRDFDYAKFESRLAYLNMLVAK